ncbi:Grap2 and cyclin-D-interacting-domain-containing protein [Phyllosticta citricarpa]|uniref:Grap2 and cyclin-D-interacting-domain-containing protein n=1 Tax=Phyllosticta citricarpa TaxID=55181 RepID=A0ABR1MS53_9PEZI
MAPASTPTDLKALVDLAESTSTLLSQFLKTLTNPSQDGASAPLDENIDPLALLHDSAKLLRAHTTKLSLLLINKPFTASAITKVLREVSGTVLPAMMGGVQLASQLAASHKMPVLVEKETRARVRRILSAFSEEAVEIKGMAERVLDEGNGGGKEQDGREGRDTLSSTGVVWQACDALMEVQQSGFAGILVQRVEEWKSTLLDAVEELKEWVEDDEDDEDEDEDEDEDSGDDEEFDDMFGGDKMPKGNRELREQLEKSLKKTKTISVLYQAIVKRRLKALPKQTSVHTTEKLDQLMDILQSIPETVDEMASSFYDLDGEEAAEIFNKCCSDAVRASELVKQNWEAKDDEFTTWSSKFQDAIKT